jgi:hypothetical protein
MNDKTLTLVVDDERSVTELLKAQLEESDFRSTLQMMERPE